MFVGRRTSIDMRYNVFDPPKQEDPVSKQQYLLSVDEAYYSKYRREYIHLYTRLSKYPILLLLKKHNI